MYYVIGGPYVSDQANPSMAIKSSKSSNPKQQAFWEISHFSTKHVNYKVREKQFFRRLEICISPLNLTA